MKCTTTSFLMNLLNILKHNTMNNENFLEMLECAEFKHIQDKLSKPKINKARYNLEIELTSECAIISDKYTATHEDLKDFFTSRMGWDEDEYNEELSIALEYYEVEGRFRNALITSLFMEGMALEFRQGILEDYTGEEFIIWKEAIAEEPTPRPIQWQDTLDEKELDYITHTEQQEEEKQGTILLYNYINKHHEQ